MECVLMHLVMSHTRHVMDLDIELPIVRLGPKGINRRDVFIEG